MEFNWVYILEVKGGSYYTGYAADLKKRLAKHFANDGAKFTKAFKPKELRQAWKVYGPRGNALKLEAFVKKQPRIVKDSFVSTPGNLSKLFNKNKESKVKLISLPKKHLL
jgi:putative endonuclease